MRCRGEPSITLARCKSRGNIFITAVVLELSFIMESFMQAAIGLDFCRCNSHRDKDLVIQQAVALHINYNRKCGETKKFSREHVIFRWVA